MSKMLRIAIADDEAIIRKYLETTLASAGHRVIVSARTGRELVEKCLAKRPDIVIADIRMPEMDGIDAAEELSQHLLVPVILLSAYHDRDTIDRAVRDHVMAYLLKPIKQAELETSIPVALRRFHEFVALRRERADLNQTLLDRKLIERAKGILMTRSALSERDAYRSIQQMARDTNRKLVDIAAAIIEAQRTDESRN